MSKVLAAILLVFIFSGPALAGGYCANEDTLTISDLSRMAGEYYQQAAYEKMLYYDFKIGSYADYRSIAIKANSWIRLYNRLLSSNYNASIYEERKMSEFTI